MKINHSTYLLIDNFLDTTLATGFPNGSNQGQIGEYNSFFFFYLAGTYRTWLVSFLTSDQAKHKISFHVFQLVSACFRVPRNHETKKLSRLGSMYQSLSVHVSVVSVNHSIL